MFEFGKIYYTAYTNWKGNNCITYYYILGFNPLDDDHESFQCHEFTDYGDSSRIVINNVIGNRNRAEIDILKLSRYHEVFSILFNPKSELSIIT